MWLFTKTGFYSIVQKTGERRLTVRARARGDLVALKRDYLPSLGKIVRTPKADYAFRAVAGRAAVARALAKIAIEIDYPNFKDEVMLEQGVERVRVYHRVWADLLDLQGGAQGGWIDGDLRQAALQAEG